MAQWEGEILLFRPCCLLLSGISEVKVLVKLLHGRGEEGRGEQGRGKGRGGERGGERRVLLPGRNLYSVQAEGVRAPSLEESLPHYFLIRMEGASR